MQIEQTTGLELFEKGLTKTEIKSMASTAVESVLEQGNALQVGEALSAMESFIKEVKADKRFTEYIREEAAKHPKGFVSNSGAKIECIEAGAKYDYSECGDIDYERMDAEMKGLKERISKREKFLQTIPIEGITQVNESTGEVYKIFPPSKSSTSTYKVTLNK